MYISNSSLMTYYSISNHGLNVQALLSGLFRMTQLNFFKNNFQRRPQFDMNGKWPLEFLPLMRSLNSLIAAWTISGVSLSSVFAFSMYFSSDKSSYSRRMMKPSPWSMKGILSSPITMDITMKINWNYHWNYHCEVIKAELCNRMVKL